MPIGNERSEVSATGNNPRRRNEMINKNQEFKIKREWCDSEAEAALTYTCTGCNGDAVYGKTLDTGLTIIPTEKFEERMIELVK
jgi:hypothetical protein